jgi:hypothetical protein
VTAEERTGQVTNTDLPGSNGLPANGLPANTGQRDVLVLSGTRTAIGKYGGGRGIAAIFERL